MNIQDALKSYSSAVQTAQQGQADAKVALDQAEAQLAKTVREVRTLFANNATLTAQIRLREADLARAQAYVTALLPP